MDDDFFGRRFGRRGFDDFDSFFFSDFNRVFQEMDQMMKQFGRGNFNMIEGPNQSKPPEAIEPPPNQPKNLRDRFLKDRTNQQQERESSSFIFPNTPFQGHGFNNHLKFDEDLDTKIEREGFDKVLREDLFRNFHHHHPPPQPPHFFPPPVHPHPHQHFSPFQPPQQQQQQQRQNHTFNLPQFFNGGGQAQAYTIRRIQRPDGSIEEVKTVRNADGKEEKTVTRIIGDKAHSIIEKKANNQVQETEEIFHNFDEDKIDEFNRMWNNISPNNNKNATKNQLPLQQSPQQPKAIKSGNEQEVTAVDNSANNMLAVKAEKTPSIFSKLFSWLKK